MLIVLAAIALLATVPLAAITVTQNQQRLTMSDDEYNAALVAAEAGLNSFVQDLNQNGNYAITNSGSWSSWNVVPNTSVPTEAYQYESSPDYTSGDVSLTVHGKAYTSATSVTRTISVRLHRDGFLNYIYFTDYETMDPGSPDYNGYATQAANNCKFHQQDLNTTVSTTRNPVYGPNPNPWSVGSGNTESCIFIEFGSGDSLNGPVRSNDGFNICGNPKFSSSVESASVGQSHPTSNYQGWTDMCPPSNPSWAKGPPTQALTENIPTSDPNLQSDASSTGCLFTGPTFLHFYLSGGKQYMSVYSPNSKYTETSPSSTNPSWCGANSASVPLSSVATTGKFVIYDQNVPSSTADPNYSASCVTPYSLSGCTSGDVYVDGTIGDSTQVTVAAANNINVDGNIINQDCTDQTGTLKCAQGSSTVMGLLADNYVQVYHPIKTATSCHWWSGCSTTEQEDASCPAGAAAWTYGGTLTACDLVNPEIDAAVQARLHSFWVDNYQVGPDPEPSGTCGRDASPLGKLTVVGSIVQEFRGTVATTCQSYSGSYFYSGYEKNYNYDSRLTILAPPDYIEPSDMQWKVEGSSYAETTP